MTTKFSTLPPDLRDLASKYLVLLQSHNIKKKRDTIQLNLSGYSDVMFLIADIVKVSILALEAGEHEGTAHIPEPSTNIAGVLGIVLDLIPYEEADLLDYIRESVLQPEEATSITEDFIEENIYLSVPSQLVS